MKNQGTSTSSFGVKGRYGHDSSKFYNSKLYLDLSINKDINFIENSLDKNLLNKLFCKNSRDMSDLPDNSIHLMITSPPYNVGKDYDENLSLSEYLNLLKDVFKETYRVLVGGGRACVNIANLGRKPYIPLSSYINQIMLEIGFLMRGEIIWNKSINNTYGACAWGSWQSASNPILRDVHEYILIYTKGSYKREKEENKKSTISKDEFLNYTKSVWNFKPESAKRIGHPAPFPIELPYRLIQFYSFENDIILDPFCGSGSTCIAALKTKRKYVGYDTNKDYILLAEERIKSFTRQLRLDW